VISKKLKENSKEKIQIRNYKAAQYAQSRGFEGDLIWDIIKQKNNYKKLLLKKLFYQF
jgi:hypothetical protein